MASSEFPGGNSRTIVPLNVSFTPTDRDCIEYSPNPPNDNRLAGTARRLSLGRWRPSTRGDNIDIQIDVVRTPSGYREAAHDASGTALRCFATPPRSGEVAGVTFDLTIREVTTQRVASGRGSGARPLRTILWRHRHRQPRNGDVYKHDIPLPLPAQTPFSVELDAHGRGVIWELDVRVVRVAGPPLVRRCTIDVKPKVQPEV